MSKEQTQNPIFFVNFIANNPDKQPSWQIFPYRKKTHRRLGLHRKKGKIRKAGALVSMLASVGFIFVATTPP